MYHKTNTEREIDAAYQRDDATLRFTLLNATKVENLASQDDSTFMFNACHRRICQMSAKTSTNVGKTSAE